jgi:hypothetical protein
MSLIVLPDLPWRKISGAVAVAVLHIAIVAVLLNATIVQRIFKPAPRETILLLPPLPKPQAASQVKPEIKRVAPPTRTIVPALNLQNSTSVTLPQTPPGAATANSIPGFKLYDCREKNLSKLSEDQRAACAKAQVGPKEEKGDDLDYADHSDQIPGAERWAREKARKNAPPLLPCASNQSIAATASAATIACLANGVINGFDLDAQPSYGERPEDEGHVPNNGDPPPIYKDPDH